MQTSRTVGAAKLVAYREKLGLTQGEMAQLIGLAQGHLSSIESGSRMPGRDLILKITEATREAVAIEDWFRQEGA